MNKAKTKKAREKSIMVRVEHDLAEEVRKVLPVFRQKIGFKVTFQGFVEKAIRECVEREKPKEKTI